MTQHLDFEIGRFCNMLRDHVAKYNTEDTTLCAYIGKLNLSTKEFEYFDGVKSQPHIIIAERLPGVLAQSLFMRKFTASVPTITKSTVSVEVPIGVNEPPGPTPPVPTPWSHNHDLVLSGVDFSWGSPKYTDTTVTALAFVQDGRAYIIDAVDIYKNGEMSTI